MGVAASRKAGPRDSSDVVQLDSSEAAGVLPEFAIVVAAGDGEGAAAAADDGAAAGVDAAAEAADAGAAAGVRALSAEHCGCSGEPSGGITCMLGACGVGVTLASLRCCTIKRIAGAFSLPAALRPVAAAVAAAAAAAISLSSLQYGQ